MSDDVQLARFGPGVLTRLTAWATDYAGPCKHSGLPQLARVDALRSQCWVCVNRDDSGWSTSGSCDCCGAYVEAADRWWVPDPAATAGVAVWLRLCNACSRTELDEMEDEMTTTTTTGCCSACMTAFAREAVRTLRGHDFAKLHDSCRAALAQGLRGYGRATAGDPNVRDRLAMVAAVRSLRGAA